MFVGLTRTQRLRAGWLVALAYLFCVLAPTISFALPGGHATPYCLTDDDQGPGVVHVHNEGIVPHVHKDGHLHDHSGIQSHAHAAGEHHANPIALNDGSSPAKAPHSSDGKCCGLMCVTALPATLVDVAKPLVPKAVREAESYRKLTDNAPPQRYRPPIS
ncbi:MAG: hypothetical protein I4N50_20525 [Rhizobium sp.]|nr:hypothetical protein [Rhizobium sp.]